MPCCNVSIRVDKPPGFGIIVSALEIVQPRFGIIDIPAVAEGVKFAQRVRHGAGGGQRITPCIIGVRYHLRAAAVDQPGHIALCILQVEVLRAIVGDGHGPQLVVGEVQRRIAGGCRNIDLRQRVAKVGIACPRSLARVDDLTAGIAGVIDAAVFADSVPAGVIAEADHFRVAGSIGTGHLLQLAAVLPTVAPCAVVGQVTDGIGGQCLSVVAGEQILPCAVAIAVGVGIQCRAQRAGGVGILRLAEDITAVVVGVDPRLARRLIVLAGQLVEAVVDVAGGVGAVGDGGDVPTTVVGVGIGRAADCPLVDLRTGGGRSGILVGDAGADNGAAAALGRNAGHAAVDIVGVVGTLAACWCLLRTPQLVFAARSPA